MMKAYVLVAGLTAALSAVTPNVAHAGFWNGNKLMELINGEQRVDTGNVQTNDYQRSANLIGYVSGVFDTLDGTVICAPDGVTEGQVVGIVEKYMRDHPDKWNLRASTLVANSLRLAFPCRR